MVRFDGDPRINPRHKPFLAPATLVAPCEICMNLLHTDCVICCITYREDNAIERLRSSPISRLALLLASDRVSIFDIRYLLFVKRKRSVSVFLSFRLPPLFPAILAKEKCEGGRKDSSVQDGIVTLAGGSRVRFRVGFPTENVRFIEN